MTPAATAADLRHAYRERTLETHPDKNPSTDASEQFAAIRRAFEVLSNPAARKAYDLYGPSAFHGTDSSPTTQDRLLTEAAVFYAAMAVVTFVWTMNRSAAAGRSWAYAGLLLTAMYELSAKLAHAQVPVVIPLFTTFEHVAFLRRLYPAFLNACAVLSMHTYVDVEFETLQRLHDLEKCVLALTTSVGLLHRRMDTIGGRGKRTALPESEADEVGEALRRSAALPQPGVPAAAAAAQALRSPPQRKSNQLSSLLMWVGMVLFFKYMSS